MKTRCIHLFPELTNSHIIDEIRLMYDPLAKKIPPHITLVFPFQSSLSKNDLVDHCNTSLSNHTPFEISMQNITAVNSFGHYLYLHLQDGMDQVRAISTALYRGALEEFCPEWLNKGMNYLPHVTVGKLETEEKMLYAASQCSPISQEFTARIDKVIVEVIGDNEESIIEHEHILSS